MRIKIPKMTSNDILINVTVRHQDVFKRLATWLYKGKKHENIYILYNYTSNFFLDNYIVNKIFCNIYLK